MWIADMDFASPQPVIDALRERAAQGIYGYTARPGSLYEAISGWMMRRHDWAVERDWICYSPGVVTALIACVQTFTSPGDGVIIQPPVYPPFAKLVEGNGRKVVANPLIHRNGRYEMDFADLEQKIKETGARLLILCSPHNPVGRVWTRAELERLTELCLAHGVLIVSDEIHADLVFPNHKHTPLAVVSEKAAASSIICMAPSKTFNIPGLSTSFIIIPNPDLREAFDRTLQDAHQSMTNTFGIVASESAYRHGDEWLSECLSYIRANTDFAIAFFERNLPEIRTTNPEGTFLLWLDCRDLGMDPYSLAQFMIKEARVALSSGSDFGKEGDGFLRMNLACRRSTLEEGLRRIEKAVKVKISTI